MVKTARISQKDMMAHHFDHHFRDMLLREPVSRCETELPSPWALRRKIIIKNRKLPPDDTIKHNICDKDDADDKQFQAGLGKVQVQKLTKKLYYSRGQVEGKKGH